MSEQLRRRIERLSRLALLTAGLVAIGAWAFGRGTDDWRYEIAGLGNPFLGRPSVGSGILVNVVLTAVVAGIAILVRAASRRHSPTSALTGRAARWPWLLLVVAGWGGYVAGGAVVIARGGPTVTGGTMHIDFGPPIDSSADVPISCRSVVGDPGRVGEIDPTTDGLFRFVLRDITTGGLRTPADAFLTDDGIPGNEFEPGGVRERVAPHMLVSQADGSRTEARSITFMQAYDHHVTRSVESGRSGIVELSATRWHDTSDGPGYRWVDLEIPNDPWPASYTLSIAWTCKPSAP